MRFYSVRSLLPYDMVCSNEAAADRALPFSFAHASILARYIYTLIASIYMYTSVHAVQAGCLPHVTRYSINMISKSFVGIGETMSYPTRLDPNKVQFLRNSSAALTIVGNAARGVHLALPFARRRVVHLQLTSRPRRTKQSSSR
jgi:hypothetical protein